MQGHDGSLKPLYALNTPAILWRCLPDIDPDEWLNAIKTATPLLLGDLVNNLEIEDLLEYVLGEGYLGENRWRLAAPLRSAYLVRKFMPRFLVSILRVLYHRRPKQAFPLSWPIEDRYVQFQWAVMSNVLLQRHLTSALHIAFWPKGRRFALVLTHDVDTQKGYDFVLDLAALEEQYGFRSSFNFVPERYRLDRNLLIELQQRGFEIGVHGLRHDGRLFSSRKMFAERVDQINSYLKQWGVVGFRSPLTHRQPQWMQLLDIEYDTSFFDTDPYETMPGGTMSIWPFFVGRFIELPYTLAQDHTLMISLKESSPRLWLEKVDFIARYSGMALSVTHPDYLSEPSRLRVYERFLQTMQQRHDYWHTLPRDLARWWRERAQAGSVNELPFASIEQICLAGNTIQLLACSRLRGSPLVA